MRVLFVPKSDIETIWATINNSKSPDGYKNLHSLDEEEMLGKSEEWPLISGRIFVWKQKWFIVEIFARIGCD